MKNHILLILVFNFSWLFAQETGIINDPDGYTNIRNGKGTSYEIIGKIEESDQFLYSSSETTNWWKVKTKPSYGKSIEGYVHKSRIQPFYMEAPNCHCPNDYGMENSRTVLLADLGKTKVAVCGYLHQRTGDSSIKISEFTISNCETNEILRFYGALSTCLVKTNGNSLEITELNRLPLGKGFQWIQTPYRKVILSEASGVPTFGDEQFVLDLSNISNTDVNSFVDELSSYKNKGDFSEIETFIGKLLICTLKGNKQCEEIFNNAESDLNSVFDGAVSELYEDCKNILEQSRN